MTFRRVSLAAVGLLTLLATPALAQDALAPAATTGAFAMPTARTLPQAEPTDIYTSWDGIRDKFSIRVGAFFVSHDTFTRLQPRDLPDIPGVNLESDIDMPGSTTDFRVDAHLNLGKRHRIRLGWWQMDRQVITRLTGEINWEGEVYPIDTEIGAKWNTQVVKADYRFAVFKGTRYDVGIALGFFVMRTDTGLAANPGDDVVTTDTKKTAPLPMVGLDVQYDLARRLRLRGFGQFFGISIDDTVDGDWYEARVALEWFPYRNVGLGLGYNFAKIDIGIQFAEGNVSIFEYRYKFNGPHLYLIGVF